MSDCTIVVNNCKYTFKKFDLNEGKREISVEADNQKSDLLLQQWFYESVDNGQGINPNYKKDIKIESNNKIYCFEGCFVKNHSIYPAKAIISYDFLLETQPRHKK
ncbi:hypothetical protein H6F62_12220 [Anabaena sp. FACHB-1391]|jgi:hypothetical protein|uniref:hypothetical protein n=1 Tax=Anabaena sp. FACHB-1391 TaxID=2692771 RepID=UPI00167FEA7A|nr:hypothetical protein [Anabaena sp. FACHB-1391]MBD2269509.1 hypothetical protein [Anabaena sp. FACHB-1391]MBO1060605.1 hypothetical protein [Aphanizomenon flos-aquae CP01]